MHNYLLGHPLMMFFFHILHVIELTQIGLKEFLTTALSKCHTIICIYIEIVSGL